MEVILLEPIEKVGLVGDVVKVKDGFARNFLIPQGKVLRATNENKEIFESKRAEIEKENDDKKGEAANEAAKIEDKFVVLVRQAGDDGRLYGSVTSRDISSAISESLGVKVDKSQVPLDRPVKYVGVYKEKVSLHPEVSVVVNVNVARSKNEAQEAEKEFLSPAKKKSEAGEVQVQQPFEAEEGEEAK